MTIKGYLIKSCTALAIGLYVSPATAHNPMEESINNHLNIYCVESIFDGVWAQKRFRDSCVAYFVVKEQGILTETVTIYQPRIIQDGVPQGFYYTLRRELSCDKLVDRVEEEFEKEWVSFLESKDVPGGELYSLEQEYKISENQVPRLRISFNKYKKALAPKDGLPKC